MNLREGKTGRRYVAKDIQLEDKLKRRLQMLGLTEGTDICILNHKRSGSMVVKIRGTRFAVGKEIAEGVYVEEGELNE